MNATTNKLSFKSIYTDFLEITKARLAISVVFSSIAGFMLGISSIHSLDWMVLVKLAIGGYCMVGASNAFNQVIEKELDDAQKEIKDINNVLVTLIPKYKEVRGLETNGTLQESSRTRDNSWRMVSQTSYWILTQKMN